MKKTTTIVGLFAAVTMFVAGGQQTHAQAATPAAAQPNIVEIKPGDNLSKIAEAHNSTYKRIYDANLNIEHPDKVYPGEKVRVPAPEEQLASRELPVAVQTAPKAAVAPATQSKAVTAPKRAAAPRAVKVSSTAPSGSVWDRLAACESGGNWSINTGNGYYGGLQFSLSSWRAVGGSGYPHQASKSEQIARAQILQSRQGWGAWPSCTSKLGIR